MANEINKLNIGGTEYPIYSEGVKLSKLLMGGTKFLTASGASGNQTIGVSNAIVGNQLDGIQIKSESISIAKIDGYASHVVGDGEMINVTSGKVSSNASDSNGNSSIIQQIGAGIYIGSNIIGDGNSRITINNDYDPMESLDSASTGIAMHSVSDVVVSSETDVEIYSPNIHIGGNESDWIVDKIVIGTEPPVGDDASDWRDIYADREIIIGANWVNVGGCATSLNLGAEAVSIVIGDYANNIYFGSSASNLTIGAGATNIHLGSGSSNIEIGSAGIKFIPNKSGTINNSAVYIGYNDTNVANVPNTIRLGTRKMLNASTNTNNTYNTLYLGANTYPVDNGTAYKGVSIGSSSYKIKDGYFHNLYYAGSCTKSSDERLKNFGDNLKVDFDALANIRKANYTWKDTEQYGSQNNIGVSAQELREVYPEFVVEDSETGLLSVDYSGLSVVALAAIDELHKENVELKSRLDKLEALLTKIIEQ